MLCVFCNTRDNPGVNLKSLYSIKPIMTNDIDKTINSKELILVVYKELFLQNFFHHFL